MKRRIALPILFIFSIGTSLAEEGMLIPSLIQAFESDMKAMGMKLSAQDIYDVNHSSLKDAIIHFGGGCTAELVSGQGLLLTNHHCGYSQIQSHSSLENDYLKYGFWAKNFAEEKPNPGLTASRIVRIQDVTADMFFGTEGLSGDALKQKLQANAATLINDARTGNHYEADIQAFNYGNEYYMIVEETFLDVRLVGTPPNSIGKFGGDTDNWVWPRHTGDFSVFRIYAGANNMPAEYSTSNVPYKPLHFLPVSMKNRVPGEFTMVYGFPGQTEQHLSSDNVQFYMERERPARIRMREKSLSVIDAGMRSSDEIRIKYASKQARIANAWKKWIGQVDGLKTVDAIGIKEQREALYNSTANSRREWAAKYGNVINELNALTAQYSDAEFDYAMGIEYLYVGPEFLRRAAGVSKFLSEFAKMEKEEDRAKAIENQRKGAAAFFKDYDENIDKQIFILLTEEYVRQMEGRAPAFFQGKDIAELAEAIYSNSVLTNEARYNKFLDKVSAKSLAALRKKDVGFKLWEETNNAFVSGPAPQMQIYTEKRDALLKTYVAGRLEMFPDAKHWPDANSTLRITYGKLEGSEPHDGMRYTEHTTLDGIISKNNTGHPDYELLPRMRELAANKEYGQYAQDGELWVCFTGSNHTTGGNSGSPVIDGEGNLMGLNFDRTWESTMSDFMFDASRCRNITVDIRYVMWVMDVYSGAKHLVDEMTIVR